MFKKIFFTLIISFLIINNSFSKMNVYIVLAVNEEILTNFDIKKESDYLKALNPNLAELPEKKVLELAKESLVIEIIKKRK